MSRGKRKEEEEVQRRRSRSEKSIKLDNFCHNVDGGRDGGGSDGHDGGSGGVGGEVGCRCCSSQTEDHMIGCDGPCAGWFHYDCVGISDTFSSRASWYCETCFLQLSGGGVEVCLCREWWQPEHELVRCLAVRGSSTRTVWAFRLNTPSRTGTTSAPPVATARRSPTSNTARRKSSLC